MPVPPSTSGDTPRTSTKASSWRKRRSTPEPGSKRLTDCDQRTPLVNRLPPIRRSSASSAVIRSFCLVATQYAHHDALYADVVLVDVRRRHRLVGRLKPNPAVAFPVHLFHGRRRSVEHRNDHLAIVGALPLVDDDEVAVANVLVDHRVALHAQDVVIPAALNEALRDRHGFLVSDCLDGHASGNRPNK